MNDGFELELVQQEDFRFEVRFDDPALAPLVTDEPPPLGRGSGPNPARLLAASVANCLAASLLFALRKFRNEPGSLRALARVSIGRNEHNRLRITGVEVDLHLGVEAAKISHLDRILGQFEDFCVVTQSIREAVPVTVAVFDAEGTILHRGA